MGYYNNNGYNDNYPYFNNNGNRRNNNNNGRNGGKKYNNNNNYYNNQNNNRNNNRPPKQNENLFFDATRYKLPDIKIKDLRGRVYILSGNLAEMYSVEMAGYAQRIMDAQGKEESLENNVEIFNILKDWTMGLLNFNVQGEEVTEEDIKLGWDGVTMMNLLTSISEYIGQTTKRVAAMQDNQ